MVRDITITAVFIQRYGLAALAHHHMRMEGDFYIKYSQSPGTKTAGDNNPIAMMEDSFFTVEPDLIATEMLVFPSKSSRNKDDSGLTIVMP